MPKRRHPFPRKPTGNQHSEEISPSLRHFAFGVEPLRIGTSKDHNQGSLAPDSLADPQPSNNSVTNEILQRPLPDLPVTRSRQSSTSSVRSNCPSLTPSLMQYVDSGDFDKEEVQLDTAQPLAISHASMQVQAQELEIGNDSKGSLFSISDYESSLDSATASRSDDCLSLDDYLPATGSVLERHLDEPDSPIARSSPTRIKAKIQVFAQEAAPSDDEEDHAEAGLPELTEAEWLTHVPSPLRRKTGQVQRLQSPQPDKRTSDSSSNYSVHSDNTLKVESDGDVAPWAAPKPSADLTKGTISPPKGNWI